MSASKDSSCCDLVISLTSLSVLVDYCKMLGWGFFGFSFLKSTFARGLYRPLVALWRVKDEEG